jgi:hypothetical protein
VWKALNKQGQKRQVKLILAPERTDEDHDPIAVLQALEHEALVPLEVVPCPGNRLALITDPGDGSLYERMKEAQQQGEPGIPRPELLGHMEVTAEALDTLYQTYRIQHLCLTPRHLLLCDGQLRILDYGLMEVLWLPAGYEVPAVNTRYSAPELYSHQSSRVCDLYSLALIYQELLTGAYAFRNSNARQTATARLRGNPDVGLLSGQDRAVVLRALATNPDQRYRSCGEFVAALQGKASGLVVCPSALASQPAGTMVSPAPRAEARDQSPLVLPSAAGCSQQRIDELQQVIGKVVEAAAGGREIRAIPQLHYALLRADAGGSRSEPCLEAHGFGRLVPATLHLKLKVFREQWRAEVLAAPRRDPRSPGPSQGDTARFTFMIHLPGNLWQRALGRQPGVEVQLDFQTPQGAAEELTDVRVRMRAPGFLPDKAAQVLGDAGPALLESLRTALQLDAERRGESRLPYLVTIQVYPLMPTRELGEPIVAQAKDITTQGMGLYLPCRPTTSCLYLQISPPDQAPVRVPACIVRTVPCADGRYEVGTRFTWEDV